MCNLQKLVCRDQKSVQFSENKCAILGTKKRKPLIFNGFRSKKVSKMRVELTRPIGHYPLKVARLPIPPPGQKRRAKDGTRTRDPDLGKVVLYQLSYFRSQFRPLCRGAFVNCGAKI